jgi:hypothetical protein
MATATLSAEESEKAEQIMKNEANDDEFKDALEEEEVDGQGNFCVTQEELAIIRAELACEFPEDYNYLSDAYILSVASKPYSKDPTIRRPLEVSRLGIRFDSTRIYIYIFQYDVTIWTSTQHTFIRFSFVVTVFYGKVDSCNGMASPRGSAGNDRLDCACQWT